MRIEIEIPDDKIRAAVQEAADSALKSYTSGGSGGPLYRLLTDRTVHAVRAAVNALDIDAMVAGEVARIAGSTVEAAVAKAIKARAKAAIKRAAGDEKAAGGPLFANRPHEGQKGGGSDAGS